MNKSQRKEAMDFTMTHPDKRLLMAVKAKKTKEKTMTHCKNCSCNICFEKYCSEHLSPEMTKQAKEIIQELSETPAQRIKRETKELFSKQEKS